MILLTTALVLFIAAALFFVRCVVTAPYGEEDELGFHEIPGPAPVVAMHRAAEADLTLMPHAA